MILMKKNGYTLIEILAVLAITGFIFTLGYSGFRVYAQRQQTTSIVRGINADLRLAQEQAIAGKKPAGCSGLLNGYKFFVDGVNMKYSVSATCVGGDVSIKSVSLPTGFSISSPSTNPIIFKPIGQGTNIPDGTQLTITVTNISINYASSVTLGSGGDIQQ